jgi:hypothetical protein
MGMRFSRKGALGIATPVLLGSVLVAGAAALPANAKSWQDTALAAGQVQVATFAGAGLAAANGNGVIKLSGTGVTWSLHGTVPSGVTLSGTTISYSGAAVTNAGSIVVDATDSTGTAQALEIPIALGSKSIQVGGTVVKVSLSGLADANLAGTVKFSATSSKNNDTVNFAETSLPTGLTSGNPVLTYVGGTAAPGTYGGVVVTATDADGAAVHGTFGLTVQANAVSDYGDLVNPYGNGFDVFQQNKHAGAKVVGWTPTQADPATHFIRNNGAHSGAYQFEYAPNGSGSGLCVSDPGGGWKSDPLRDGLILTVCNTGPFQQFIPQSNGTLRNLATGLYVNPNGTGSQLRGAANPVSWGGSKYSWKNYTDLPG